MKGRNMRAPFFTEALCRHEIELCEQETAEVLITLALAGCTLEEARAYMLLTSNVS